MFHDVGSSEDTSSNTSSNSELSYQDDTTLNQQAYNQIDASLPVTSAFLYRKDDLNELSSSKLEKIIEHQEAYMEQFIDRAAMFFATNNPPTQDQVKDFSLAEQSHISDGLPIKKVIGYFIGKLYDNLKLSTELVSKTTVAKVLDNLLEEDNQAEDGSLDERNTTDATLTAYEQFFGKDYDTLTKHGMVYVLPKDKHRWSYNASWLLAHFHKGTNTFIILSEINEDGKKRGETSDSKGDFGSGFFREIAICYKLGYTCERHGSQIILVHTDPSKLKKVTLDELLQLTKDEKSLKELEEFYDIAMRDYARLQQALRIENYGEAWQQEQSDSKEHQQHLSLSGNTTLEETAPPEKKQKIENPCSTKGKIKLW